MDNGIESSYYFALTILPKQDQADKLFILFKDLKGTQVKVE